VVLVGYGHGGAVFHAPLVEATPGLRLAAVVTGNPARQAAVRARYPQARVLADPAEVPAAAGDFGLGVVSTPNRTHVEVATALLRAGLPVVVDKPVAARADDAVALGDLANSLGLLAVPFHNRRWDGDFLTVCQLVRSGRLGAIWRFESRFERWRPGPVRDVWREDPSPDAAGGLLYDLGAHLIDQLLVLFGPPTSVVAELAMRRPGARVDDDTFLSLAYPDGLVAQLWASSCAAQTGPRFRLLGSEAAYVKCGLDGQEAALQAGVSPAGPAWGVEDEQAWGQVGRDGDRVAVPTRPGAYPDFYAAVLASLQGSAPAPVTMVEAIAGLQIIEAARRSAAGGGMAVPAGVSS